MTAHLHRRLGVAASARHRASRPVCCLRRPSALRTRGAWHRAWSPRHYAVPPRRHNVCCASSAADPHWHAARPSVSGRWALLWRTIVKLATHAFGVCCLAAATVALAFWSRRGARAAAPHIQRPAPSVVAQAVQSVDLPQCVAKPTSAPFAAVSADEMMQRFVPITKVTQSLADYDPSPMTKGGWVRPQWRRQLTYTQFLLHLRHGDFVRVRYNYDGRKLFATFGGQTTVPVGARHTTWQVATIPDPTLADKLGAAGVECATGAEPLVLNIAEAFARKVLPCVGLVIAALYAISIGSEVKTNQVAFGGQALTKVGRLRNRTTFKDVAGLDSIREEISEVVGFLESRKEYAKLGARPPAGVLLAGPPGTGKTLIARAIAGEADVPFFNVSGTDFNNSFTGVGARKVRDMFTRARKAAPCIIFIDEFDSIGMSRAGRMDGGGAAGLTEQQVQTINQLLTEMDGFDDNQGIVMLAATNRPEALDAALTRPGRFDRMINVPLPNKPGRIAILGVHSANKAFATDVNMDRVARATAGFTGADLKNLLDRAALIAVMQNRPEIKEGDIFEAMEAVVQERQGGGGLAAAPAEVDADERLTALRSRTFCTYLCAKALLGMLAPVYDECYKIVGPHASAGVSSGYVYFIPNDTVLESTVMSQRFLESQLTVCLAGRTAETAVMGAAHTSSLGAADIMLAHSMVRVMVFSAGWSEMLGPVTIMDTNEGMSSASSQGMLADMTPAMAAAGYAEFTQRLRAAEAKAYFGIVTNWALLQDLTETLLGESTGVLTMERIDEVVARHKIKRFVDEGTAGFGFDEDNRLIWPAAYDGLAQDVSKAREHVARVQPSRFEPYPYDKAPLNPLGNYVSLLGQADAPSHAIFHPEAFTGSLRASAKVSMYLDPEMLPNQKPVIERTMEEAPEYASAATQS